jgi:dipeptidyl aminopeptidase/acylaminoacyl peptidase
MNNLLRIILFQLFICFSSYSYANEVISCIDKICKQDDCYSNDLSFQSIDLSGDREKIMKFSAANYDYYKDVLYKSDFIDVTSKILNDENVKAGTKKNIKANQRRIIVFSYLSDNIRVPAFISYVPGTAKANLIVFLRGGYTNFGIPSPAAFSAFDQETIIGTLYRGIGGGNDEFGGKEVVDVKNLIEFIPTLEKKFNQKFTTNKKYLLGMSRGGMEAFRVITEYPKLQQYFDRAILLSAVLDLELSVVERPEMLKMFQNKFGLTEENKQEWFGLRSAKYHIDKIDRKFPILILQGTNDKRVGLKHGVELFQAMKKLDLNVNYWEASEATHCLGNCRDLIKILDNWFRK